MSTQVKSVPGQLFDMKTEKQIDEGMVDIVYRPPPNDASFPKYNATMTIKGIKTELAYNTYTLKLKTISGDVFVKDMMLNIERRHTLLTLNLQGAVWQHLEWFQAL